MPFHEFDESDPDLLLTIGLEDLRDLADLSPSEIISHRDHLADYLTRGLSSEYHHDRTVEAIFSLLVAAMRLEDGNLWFEPVIDLVDQQLAPVTRFFDVGLREVIADFRGLSGVNSALESARPVVIDDLLQAYIRLIKLLAFKPDLRVPPTLLDQALDVGKRLGDHVEQDKLFQAIAIYASHSGDFKTAEHYAKLAYIDAERIEDPERIVDAACTLAIVYRFDLRFSNADYYIRRAISKEASKIPNIRFATLFYENGTYYYRRDKFEQSLSEYQHALDIFEEHGAVYQIAMTQQAMAQSHIFLSNFAKAESLLRTARSTWETLGNRYEWVNSTFVEADLELKRGNHSEGIRLLRRAIDQANSVLPDTPARDLLIDQIKEHIENNS